MHGQIIKVCPFFVYYARYLEGKAFKEVKEKVGKWENAGGKIHKGMTPNINNNRKWKIYCNTCSTTNK